ncbi:sensor histidine kinase [Nesterenkonia flava]|uniref:histidine kinase n=1 Tax=Nesterenkonia flava TaxID=469799 RepID=A0ABU1FR87_9MICC|nr:histidine kinase [Nesterenkonia flava]MDR5711170.1 histidine kinase [Nesterenkonia flava]
MAPRSRLHALLRALAFVAVVVLMIVSGVLVLTLSMMTSPTTLDPVTMEITDFGATRALLGMLILLTLPWYRRTPVVLLVAGALAAVAVQTDPFVLAVGLTVWIIRCSTPWQWVIAGIGVACILTNAALHLRALSAWPDEDYQRTGQVLVVSLTVLCLSLVMGIAFWRRQKRSTERAKAQAQSARHTSEQLSDELVRQREREDLAREVHDTLAGRLSGLSLQVGSLEHSARQADAGQLDDALRTTRRYADQALSDLRLLLTSLREGGASATAPAKPPTGVQDLQDLLEDATASGLEVRPYILLDGYTTAPDALQRAVLRITQEALTNALRHSPDRAAAVRISGNQHQGIHLEFSNRSTGESDFTAGSGTGLIGIRERAQMLGGTVDVLRQQERFFLRVHLPWAREGSST